MTATCRRAILAPIPRIVTDRLVLRAPRAEDRAVAEPGPEGVEIHLGRDHEKSARVARAIGAVETGIHPLDPDRVAVYRLPPDMGATT